MAGRLSGVHPYVLDPGEGEHHGPGDRAVLKASTPQLGAITTSCARGEEPPLHFHSREDEYVVVLAGELTFQVDQALLPAGPGSFVYLPRGVPHTFAVRSEGPARLLVLGAPGGSERALANEALFEQHGIVVLRLGRNLERKQEER